MIYKSQFSLNILDLKQSRDSQEWVKAAIKSNAYKMGAAICEHIPFEVNEEQSVRRELVSVENYYPPEPAPREVYECEIFAVSKKDWVEFRKKLSTIITTNFESRENARIVMSLIHDLERK